MVVGWCQGVSFCSGWSTRLLWYRKGTQWDNSWLNINRRCALAARSWFLEVVHWQTNLPRCSRYRKKKGNYWSQKRTVRHSKHALFCHVWRRRLCDDSNTYTHHARECWEGWLIHTLRWQLKRRPFLSWDRNSIFFVRCPSWCLKVSSLLNLPVGKKRNHTTVEELTFHTRFRIVIISHFKGSVTRGQGICRNDASKPLWPKISWETRKRFWESTQESIENWSFSHFKCVCSDSIFASG